jgi:hypothetical protein
MNPLLPATRFAVPARPLIPKEATLTAPPAIRFGTTEPGDRIEQHIKTTLTEEDKAFLSQTVSVRNGPPTTGYQILAAFQKESERLKNTAYDGMSEGSVGATALAIAGSMVLMMMGLPEFSVLILAGGTGFGIYSFNTLSTMKKEYEALLFASEPMINTVTNWHPDSKAYLEELTNRGFLTAIGRTDPRLKETFKLYDANTLKFTEKGLLALNNLPQGQFQVPLLQQTETSSAPPVATTVASSEASPAESSQTLNIPLVKALLMADSESQRTGFQILKVIQELKKPWYSPKSMLGRAPTVKELRSRLFALQADSLTRQLDTLYQAGLITDPKAKRLHLTPLGSEYLAKGDPRTAGWLTPEAMHQLIQAEIDSLEADSQIRLKQFQTMEAILTEVKTQYQTLQGMSRQLQLSITDNLDQGELVKEEGLQKEYAQCAQEDLTQLKRMRVQEAVYRQWIAQMEQGQQALRHSHRQWQESMEETIARLLACQTQIRLTQAAQKLARLHEDAQNTFALKSFDPKATEALIHSLQAALSVTQPDLKQMEDNLALERILAESMAKQDATALDQLLTDTDTPSEAQQTRQEGT